MSKSNIKNTKQSSRSHLSGIGIGKEKTYFVDNLSLLLGSGLPVISSLTSLKSEIKSKSFRKRIDVMILELESGLPLWKSLAQSGIFPEHMVSLIRIGEETGKLSENLQVLALQQEKERDFASKLSSALMYPVFVFTLTIVIGVGIAWFILPRLATVFSQLHLKLPLLTRVLISIGTFLGENGWYVIPLLLLVLFLSVFVIFFYPKTKFLGQKILFTFPAIRNLIQEVEIARFGFILGTLLQAGLPITDAIGSLKNVSTFYHYQKFYSFLLTKIDEGNSLQKSFGLYKDSKRLFPTPIQQLLFSSEQSGQVSKTLLKIGEMYETKTETTTKNLTVILEPILLVIVWLGVVGVALAVILPLYSLIGGLNDGSSGSSSTSQTTISKPVIVTPIIIKKSQIEILPTDVGYVNLRETPSLTGRILQQVQPEDVFEYKQFRDNWYEVNLTNSSLATSSGWIFGDYAEVISNVK